MLQQLSLEKVLFLDIETVPAQKDFHNLSDRMKKLWTKKAKHIEKNQTGTTAESLYERAGIYAEFGKIVCISVGFFSGSNFRLTSYFSDIEKDILLSFNQLLSEHFNTPQHLLCAHNGKEFDFPYIARRSLVNQLSLPAILNLAGKKPWEVQHLDTMELWKFGDFKHYTSLDLLAEIMGIPTPKDDIDGSDVGRVYWEDHDLQRIRKYCEKDVITIAQLMLRYMNKPLLLDSDIHVIE